MGLWTVLETCYKIEVYGTVDLPTLFSMIVGVRHEDSPPNILPLLAGPLLGLDHHHLSHLHIPSKPLTLMKQDLRPVMPLHRLIHSQHQQPHKYHRQHHKTIDVANLKHDDAECGVPVGLEEEPGEEALGAGGERMGEALLEVEG